MESTHCFPKLCHCSRSTMQLCKLLDFVRQIPKIEKELISLRDTQILKLMGNQRCLQHAMVALHFGAHFSQDIQQLMSVCLLDSELQASFSVLQSFWTTQKTELLSQQSQKLKTICFLNAMKSNLRFHHVVYLWIPRKTLLNQVKKTTASNTLILILCHYRVGHAHCLLEFSSIPIMDKTQP